MQYNIASTSIERIKTVAMFPKLHTNRANFQQTKRPKMNVVLEGRHIHRIMANVNKTQYPG